MNIEEFCRLHAGEVRDIQSVVREWHVTEIDELLEGGITEAP